MPTSPLITDDLNRLESVCRNLAASSVQDEEAEAARSPILILMSTVLSLNRRWYSHALPARRHFEQNLYTRLSPKTLRTFRDAAKSGSVNRTDWLALARALWGRNEWCKARILSELVDYFVDWTDSHAPNATDMEALQRWSQAVAKKEFVSQKIKGLGPRAHEQLLWYIEGKQAIKLDRHITTFVNEIINRPSPTTSFSMPSSRLPTLSTSLPQPSTFVSGITCNRERKNLRLRIREIGCCHSWVSSAHRRFSAISVRR